MYITYTKTTEANGDQNTPAAALSVGTYANDIYDDTVGVMWVDANIGLAEWNPVEVTSDQALTEYRRITERNDLSIVDGRIVFPKIYPQV